jgi:(p)ppGpp synthase/HD superfamily hydrolase
MDPCELIKAIDYTVRTHAEKPKKASKALRYWDMKTPYGVHPLWCAVTLLQETHLPAGDRTNFAVALLYHDLLEDTTITPEELQLRTSERVCGLVKAMTFENGFGEEMKEIWSCHPEVRLLKLYDKVSNLLDGTWMSKGKWEVYCSYTRLLADDVEKNFVGLNIIRIARAIAQA